MTRQEWFQVSCIVRISPASDVGYRRTRGSVSPT
ncbi:zinc finger protein rts2, partial [Moniliophthora roreri]